MIKKNDFVEIEYTGKIKETNQIFDTTSKEIAQKEKIYNPNIKYGPTIICIGQSQIIPGLDEQLENKELNKEYDIEIPPEKAFGKKNPKLLRILSSSSFRKQKINPYPGLQVNIDGFVGTVRTVTSGRIIVDFNHPLAGKNIIYTIKITKLVTDKKSQIESLISFILKDPKVELKEDTAQITAKSLPNEKLKEEIVRKIEELTKLKNVTIVKE